MTRDDLAKIVLLEVARRCNDIQARPRPPAWKPWKARDDEDDRKYGPRYSSAWFGDLASTEARRVRILRTVYRLAAADLLDALKSEGGRLERVKLSDAGRAAVAEILAAGAMTPTGA